MPEVEREQIQPEEDRHQDHDDRRRVDLFLRRPGDALQLVADLAEEQARALEAAAGRFPARVSSVVVSSCHRSIRFRLLPISLDPRSAKLAGQEGIEPPTPGFGDRCSAN